MEDLTDRSETNTLQPLDRSGPLNIDETTSWWTKQQETSPNALGPPISPLSFAFMTAEQREQFNFTIPLSPHPTSSTGKGNEESAENVSGASTSSTSSTSSLSSSKKTLDVKDLLIVDDEEGPSAAPGGNYEPKAHLGWASFGESIKVPYKKNGLSKRKIYVVRSRNCENGKPYQVNPLVANRKKTDKKPLIKVEESSDTDEDAFVDVVGIDEEEAAFSRRVMGAGLPPDLPPQRPLGSRFEMQRHRKDYYNRRGYDSDDETTRMPPCLEPHLDDMLSVDMGEPDHEEIVGETEELEKRLGLPGHDPSQMLKTKISTSAIPMLPLSKSIMERKKAAIEMTKNAIIKKVPPPKNQTKMFAVAPKSVQVPAYTDKSSITLYSKQNKPPPVAFPRDARGICIRCRDRPPVDMSAFKFVEETNVVAVRAHLCDQTRVMIARTAMWNREYARRLGDRASGTMWQRPDEVTAQMTGFCSATVRRCIDIANLSIIPKCADRIGVSKNELAILKTAFGNEKFCGQAMRTPHVLSQYFSVKAQNQAISDAAKQPSTSIKPEEEGESEEKKKEREAEEKKHHPFSNYNHPPMGRTPPPLPALKKTVLRWSAIQTPRILRTSKPPYPLPKTAVIPVVRLPDRKDTLKNQSNDNKDQKHSKEDLPPRRRGRPRKERPEEEERRIYSRRLRSASKKSEQIDLDVKQTVEDLIAKVSARHP